MMHMLVSSKLWDAVFFFFGLPVFTQQLKKETAVITSCADFISLPILHSVHLSQMWANGYCKQISLYTIVCISR